MAARTPEQQKAYNEKRRAENAARKKEADAQVKKIKAERAAAKKPTKTVVAAKPKNTSKAMREAKVRRMEKVKAKPIKGVDEVKPKAAPAPTPTNFQLSEDKPVEHTMARSYLRSGAPGMGKLRGSNYQTTVSFTESQMKQVVAAAGFRGVSLAEMIRSCVVQHLNPPVGG